jgi:hypothetical protein
MCVADFNAACDMPALNQMDACEYGLYRQLRIVGALLFASLIETFVSRRGRRAKGKVSRGRHASCPPGCGLDGGSLAGPLEPSFAVAFQSPRVFACH